jgi:hypothetical protein
MPTQVVPLLTRGSSRPGHVTPLHRPKPLAAARRRVPARVAWDRAGRGQVACGDRPLVRSVGWCPRFGQIFPFLQGPSNPCAGLAPVQGPRIWFFSDFLLHQPGEACPILFLTRWHRKEEETRGREGKRPPNSHTS